MAFAATDLASVLNAIVTQIVTDSSIFTADNCYIALNRPEPGFSPFSEESLSLLVYPNAGQFNQETLNGGGRNQCWWTGVVTVEVITPLRLDQSGREKEFLTNSTYGVGVGLQEVLNALSITQLQVSGNDVLIEPMRPEGTSQVIRDESNFGSMALDFEVSFKWGLS